MSVGSVGLSGYSSVSVRREIRTSTQNITHCPGGLHKIKWVVQDRIAICEGGHDNVVWCVAEGNRLRCEVNGSARELAEALLMAMNGTAIVREVQEAMNMTPEKAAITEQAIATAYKINTFNGTIRTDEDFHQWRLGKSQREIATLMGISRGLVGDLISGRRRLTANNAVRLSIVMQEEEGSKCPT